MDNENIENKEEESIPRKEKLTLVKKIAKIIVWIFCIVGLSILFMKTLSRHEKLTCTKLELKLENSGGSIDPKEVENQILSHFQILKKPCESINLLEIERFVKSNPFVNSSDLFFDLKGVLHISISQKIPALKVVNNLGERYMIDEQGTKMPLVADPDSSLIEIEGDIREKLGKEVDSLRSPELKSSYNFWKRISKETASKGMIRAFYIEPGNKMNILLKNLEIPMVFGDTSLLEEKIEKMNIFLTSILPKMGPGAYSRVDLRFSHEWVCERKNTFPVKDSLPLNRKINKLL